MILVDTSVWIHHLRHQNENLKHLLQEDQVLCHPFIIGELACGQLNPRKGILSLMAALPQCKIVDHQEALQFLEYHKLMGKGLGLIDIHLLACAFLSRAFLWTRDKELHKTACQLHIAHYV